MKKRIIDDLTELYEERIVELNKRIGFLKDKIKMLQQQKEESDAKRNQQ